MPVVPVVESTRGSSLLAMLELWAVVPVVPWVLDEPRPVECVLDEPRPVLWVFDEP